MLKQHYQWVKKDSQDSICNTFLSLTSQSAHIQPRQKLPLLSLIAALDIRLARKQTEEIECQKYLTIDTQYVNEADRIHNQYEPTFIVTGNLYMLLRKADGAARSFNMTLGKRPNCMPALLGRAQIQYHLRQYKDAFKTYQDVQRFSCGRLSATEIRLDIAQCFAQLKM